MVTFGFKSSISIVFIGLSIMVLPSLSMLSSSSSPRFDLEL